MKRFPIILSFLLVMNLPSICYAEEVVVNSAILEYGAESLLLDSYTVRACYSIALPDDTESIHKEVANAYQGFERILLIEYGYSTVGPILEGQFACIGINNGSEFSILPTPFDLIARTYDWALFDNISITALEWQNGRTHGTG